MSMEPWEGEEEAALDRLYNDFGPEWAREHSTELYREAISEFTAERLQSYYLAHPDLAKPAHDALIYAQTLVPNHPKAALVFATTAVELAIKNVLLRPIVFGLVHTEVLAAYITELTTKHSGVLDTFQTLLGAILVEFGGVDLKIFRREGSTKTLWQEAKEIQAARNAVIHRGDTPDGLLAPLGIAVAETLLNTLFPQVLRRLSLHLHDPCVICAKRHTTTLQVNFTIPGPVTRTVGASVEVNDGDFNAQNPPMTITGGLLTYVNEDDLKTIRSVPSQALMHVVSLPLKYQVEFEVGSTKFTGTKVAWN